MKRALYWLEKDLLEYPMTVHILFKRMMIAQRMSDALSFGQFIDLLHRLMTEDNDKIVATAIYNKPIHIQIGNDTTKVYTITDIIPGEFNDPLIIQIDPIY